MNGQESNYVIADKPKPVVHASEYCFAACGLDHGHIEGMCRGLTEAGATLKWVYDKDYKKVRKLRAEYPTAKVAQSEQQILSDPEIKLVASSCIPNRRADLGIRVMMAGKDFFVDKAPVTTIEQLKRVKDVVNETGRRFFVYFSERIHNEATIFANQLIQQGAIGDVVQITAFAPHRLNLLERPDWFFDKEQYGGILCDLGSHQIEQFLFFTNSKDAYIVNSQVANYGNPQISSIDDYGDVTLIGDNGATGFFKVDWLVPDGLRSWGDGRLFLQGTKGYIEIRKNINIASEEEGANYLYLVNDDGEFSCQAQGMVGYPFFGQLILDSINGTQEAMTQEHIFKAAELCVLAQKLARKIKIEK